MQVAYLERARGDLPAAIAAAQRAVQLRPGDAESSALLGVYLTEAGRAREAVEFLSPWLKRTDDDLDVLNALGVALATAGRPREALQVLGRARSTHPTNTRRSSTSAPSSWRAATWCMPAKPSRPRSTSTRAWRAPTTASA